MPETLRVNLPAPPTAVRVVPGPGEPSPDGTDALETEHQALEAERVALARARGALATAAAHTADLQTRILVEVEDHLLDLAVDIARKVIAQEVGAGRCDIEPIVREALDRAPPKRECVVHLHPDDLATIEKAGDDKGDVHLAHLHLTADPTVGRGECVVETAEGTVEARTDDRLRQVRAAMKPPESP